MKQLRLSLVGFGTVGQWLARALYSRRAWFEQELDCAVTIVSVANAHDGFIYRVDGLDIPTLLNIAHTRRSLTTYPDISHWKNVQEGLKATGGDLMAESTGANLRNGEPALSYIRTALSQHMHVITSSKGPIALAGLELLALARQQGVQLRMESTVMSGTPVLSTIQEGMAGVSIRSIRGIVNGTTNYILGAMMEGRSYIEGLAETQLKGYAEVDPTDDVEGYDEAAKLLILAAVAFGRSLPPEQVVRQGITGITKEQASRAREQGKRIKHVATLRLVSEEEGHGPEHLEARVEPIELPLDDPLAHIDGLLNTLIIQTSTPQQVTITGPGAGKFQAGQGMLADLIAIAKSYK